MHLARDDDRALETFLRDRVASYEQLEVLLLLRRGERMNAQTVSSQLNLRSSAVDEALASLVAQNLVDVLGAGEAATFRLAPGSPDLAENVERLAKLYELDRLAVIHLLNTHAVARVRSQAIRTFADAFLLGRGGRKNG